MSHSANPPNSAEGDRPRAVQTGTAVWETACGWNRAKTKIIATVGPACDSRDMLKKLVVAGVDVFRLNFAHGTHEWLAGVVENIRDVSRELNRPIGILADLSGPKIRLGEVPGGAMLCSEGALIRFVASTDQQKDAVQNGNAKTAGENTAADVPAAATATLEPARLTCTYEMLVDDLKPGDRVLLADGIVALRVVRKADDNQWADCIVEQPGMIRSRQGVNLPGVRLSTPSLTEKDRADLAWALKQQLDFVGLSFVRSADDIRQLEEIIARDAAVKPQIVAKIEKREALDDLDAIIECSDCVMVARGDLGVEAEITRVPVLQKQIIERCNDQRVPVITATQMLDSMQFSEFPTRAEASDVANAVFDGTDAMMLSAETAIGRYPEQAVRIMNRIAREAEKLQLGEDDEDNLPVSRRHRALEVTEAVITGAGDTACQLNAELIVIVTRSGRTALAMSEQRRHIPILGLSDDPATTRRMCLYWGVIPVETQAVHGTPQTLVEFVADWGRRHGLLNSGSKFILVTRTNWSAHGHDMLLVHEVP